MATLEIALTIALVLFSLLVLGVFGAFIGLIRAKSIQNLATALKSATSDRGYAKLSERIGENSADFARLERAQGDSDGRLKTLEARLRNVQTQIANRDKELDAAHAERLAELEAKGQMWQNMPQLSPAQPQVAWPPQQQAYYNPAQSAFPFGDGAQQ